MGREIRRVPLDFAWPLRKVWSGFVMPSSLRERSCTACKETGYSEGAYAVAETFYPHMVGGDRRISWSDKIGQAEVDYLVKKGRLKVWRDGKWSKEPRTAAEVNAINRQPGLDGHDAINRGLLVEFRCKRLGIPLHCETCQGHGSVEAYPGQRKEADEWESTPPPTGEGWQVWETVSEGSPVSPVFVSGEALSDWLVGEGYSREAADGFVKTGWAMSAMMTGGKFYKDIEACGAAQAEGRR